MNVEARKRALKYFFAKIVAPLGYKFTPDDELADFLLEQESHLEETLGSPFCPCQGRTQSHEQNMKIVCPCIPFHREHFVKAGERELVVCNCDGHYYAVDRRCGHRRGAESADS
jgi:ferredoxin-thioredoxin reductase catalytic subunit